MTCFAALKVLVSGVSLAVFFSVASLVSILVPNSASAKGGIHSGGGNGVATYREGLPQTVENLIKVESWVLFKARRDGKLKTSPSKQADENPEVYYATMIRDLKRALSNASPDFYLWFDKGDHAFTVALEKALLRYEASKKISETPIAAEMDLIDDFGRRVTLDANQSLVQIVTRERDQFDINMSLWNKMAALDRVDIRIHEAAYAVSWHSDSTRIQELQLYLIDHVLSKTVIDKTDFERRAVSEWNLFQLQVPDADGTPRYQIPGLRIDDGSERPYLDTGSTTEQQGVYPPGVPLSSRSKDLHCGMTIDWASVGVSKEIEILYLDGGESKKSKKTLSDVEFSYVQELKKMADPAILGRLNPMKAPFLYDYMPVMCFKKRFPLFGALGDLLYVEFRKAYDVEKAKLAWESSQSRVDRQYTRVISEALRAKIDAALKYTSDAKTKLTPDDIIDKKRSLEELVRGFKLSEDEEGDLMLHISNRVQSIARLRIDDPDISDADQSEWAIVLLRMASSIGLLHAREESRFAQQNPNILRPPPFTLYPGGRGSEIVRSAEKVTIVGRLGAYIESAEK